jgi:predicted transcriptional regulator
VVKWLLSIFKKKIDVDRCEELIGRAYEKGRRDIVAYIVANITSKFIMDRKEFGYVAAKIMESTLNSEKRRHMLYCITEYNSNKDRAKCLLMVVGVDPDIVEQGGFLW